MKYWVFIYARTFEHDFRSICIPPANIVKKDKLEEFAKQVINTDRESNGSLKNKRYAFSKFEKYILWGMGFSHEMASFKQYGLEKYERDCKPRTLRSFIGIIMEYSDFHQLDFIPYDDSFFFSLFEKYVTPYWHWPEFKGWKAINSKIECDNSINYGLSLNGNVQFNNEHQNCLFFPDEEERNVLSSIKNCYTNLITGLNVESHVISAVNAESSVIINNAVCLETPQSHIIQILNKTQTRIGTTESTKTLVFPSQGGLKKYRIKSNNNSIEASSTVDWVSVSCTDSLLKIIVKPNTNNLRREGTVFIVRSSDKENIIVRQDAHEDSFLKKGKEFLKVFLFSDKKEIINDNIDLVKQKYYPPSITSYSSKVNNESHSEENNLNEKLMDWGDAWNSSEDSGKKDVLDNETLSLGPFNLYKNADQNSKTSLINESELDFLLKELIQKYGIDKVYNKIKKLLDNE